MPGATLKQMTYTLLLQPRVYHISEHTILSKHQPNKDTIYRHHLHGEGARVAVAAWLFYSCSFGRCGGVFLQKRTHSGRRASRAIASELDRQCSSVVSGKGHFPT